MHAGIFAAPHANEPDEAAIGDRKTMNQNGNSLNTKAMSQ
jgi:hypothetical protein